MDVMAGNAVGTKISKTNRGETYRKTKWMDYPKDVILKVAEFLPLKGGQDVLLNILEKVQNLYLVLVKEQFCNMGAEIGLTTSTFGYDESMERYLRSTDRDDVADAANEIKEHLTGDAEVYENPEQYFDQVIEINLNELTPHLNGPFTPDLATPVAEMHDKAITNDWPDIEWALIGSCTNSSYEDLTRAAVYC